MQSCWGERMLKVFQVSYSDVFLELHSSTDISLCLIANFGYPLLKNSLLILISVIKYFSWHGLIFIETLFYLSWKLIWASLTRLLLWKSTNYVGTVWLFLDNHLFVGWFNFCFLFFAISILLFLCDCCCCVEFFS